MARRRRIARPAASCQGFTAFVEISCRRSRNERRAGYRRGGPQREILDKSMGSQIVASGCTDRTCILPLVRVLRSDGAALIERGGLMRAICLGVSVGACLLTVAPARSQELPPGGIIWPASGRFAAYPAEPDDRRVRFSLSGGVQHDSNVFRVPDSQPGDKSDTISRIGAGVTGDIPVGRQHLLFDGAVDYYNYSDFDVLDHTAYRVGAAWNWLVASQWTGDIGYATQRYLNTLDLGAQVQDLVTEDHANVSAAYQVTPRWRVRGAGDWYRWDHSEP